MVGAMIHPRVFISYSHDTQEHMDRVLALAGHLRHEGVDAHLDQYVESPPEGWPRWMQNQIYETTFVLIVCTEVYERRFMGREIPGHGLGTTWEGAIVTQALYESSLENTRFIPVVFRAEDISWIPQSLKSTTYYDMSRPEGYEHLYRRVTAQPHTVIPPLGTIRSMPPLDRKQTFQPVESRQQSSVTPTVFTHSDSLASPIIAWDTKWITLHRARAVEGLRQIDNPGYKEVRLTLVGCRINKNQRELFEVARQAEVPTFGYPMGVVSFPEYRPRPIADGIMVEFSTKDKDLFQYWSLRNNGDFYLLKRLWEDIRGPGCIFPSTRIGRVAEVFQHCKKLYTGLGVSGETEVHVAVRYGGLAGRHLQEIGNRLPFIRARNAVENEAEAEVFSPLNQIDDRIVELVKGVCSPLFMLFDFFQPGDGDYRQIVTDYVNGKAT